MAETIGRIDFSNEDFAEGLQRMGFEGYLVPDSSERMLGDVYNHALIVAGNPRINVWGVSGNQSPYEQDALDVDRLQVDAVGGEVNLYPILPPGNMGDFQEEQEAFRTRWTTLRDLEVHHDTAPIINEVIASAYMLADTQDANRTAVDSVLRVPVTEFGHQGSDPNAIVFRRLAEEIRRAYGEGRDSEAFALASIIPNMSRLNSGCWHAPVAELEDAPQTIKLILGRDVWALFENYRGQEARTLQLRALDRVIEQGKDKDAGVSEIEQKRLRVLRASLTSGYAITRLTAEVTLEDMKTYPSTANPRPDFGVPEYGGMRWLMGGSESGNTSIIYPNGNVYLGDMPTQGVTRVITPEIAEEEKRHGSYVDGEFMRTGANGVVNPGTATHGEFSDRISMDREFQSAYSSVVESLTQVSHEKLYNAHVQMLTSLCEELGFTPAGLLEDNTDNPHNSLMTGMKLFGAYIEEIANMAHDDPIMAANLCDFAFSGWGSRGNAESAAGLINGDAPNDFLMMEWSPSLWGAFRNHQNKGVRTHFDELRERVKLLKGALKYQKMIGLKEAMPQHQQISEHVDSVYFPGLTTDEAAQRVLSHHVRFSDSWLV